jgi:hypothetical protein
MIKINPNPEAHDTQNPVIVTHYHYILFNLALVHAAFAYVDTRTMPDAYLADEPVLRKICEVVNAGYRWVRSEQDYAVFELEIA